LVQGCIAEIADSSDYSARPAFLCLTLRFRESENPTNHWSAPETAIYYATRRRSERWNFVDAQTVHFTHSVSRLPVRRYWLEGIGSLRTPVKNQVWTNCNTNAA
jgi:hypothetical protein